MLLAVLLSVFTLGLLPHRRSIEMHTARWASALALAQLAEADRDIELCSGGLLNYLDHIGSRVHRIKGSGCR